MKILHTSDWHIGRTLYGRKRYDEFESFFDWLADLLEDEGIGVLLVAGDVFDNTTPSNRAQALYYRFLRRAAASPGRHVVVTARNHDSPSFLNAPRDLLKFLNIHVVGAPILEQITGTEIYSRISVAVHRRRNDEQEKLGLLQAETKGISVLGEEDRKTLETALEERQSREREPGAWLQDRDDLGARERLFMEAGETAARIAKTEAALEGLGKTLESLEDEGQKLAVEQGVLSDGKEHLEKEAAALAAHVSVNAFNEYFDFRSGLDLKTKRTPFSGGTGTLPKMPEMAPTTLITAVTALTVTAFVGVYFYFLRGAGILPLAVTGLLVVVAYTPFIVRRPLLCLIAPGLGFGPLMVVGTHFALTGTYSWTAFVASLVPYMGMNVAVNILTPLFVAIGFFMA